MSVLSYPIRLSRDGDGYLVTFPDIPEALTQGATRGEALAHAQEALEAALSFYVDEWKGLPKPSKGRLMVYPSLIGQLKLGLYRIIKKRGWKKTQAARVLGIHLMQLDRLLDLTHSSRVEQLEQAYGAAGARVAVATVTG